MLKKQEASQNHDLDTRQYLGVDKLLQEIQGNVNNTSKLSPKQFCLN